MSKKRIYYILGEIIQLLAIYFICISIYCLVTTFTSIEQVPSDERLFSLKDSIAYAKVKTMCAMLFGLFGFIYTLVMLKNGQIEIARKIRKSFFITGVLYLWGGIIPLFILIYMKKRFRKTD